MRGFDEALKQAHGVEDLIGVDEAGRGPLAGPVVAAAVCLKAGPWPGRGEVRDSKLLSPAMRASLFAAIRAASRAVSVAWAFPAEIAERDILQSTLSAMRRAALRAGAPEALVVVDGNRLVSGLPRPQRAVVDADNLSLSVACAGIVAKVVRDRWMERLDRRYPGYGLKNHKGYGTPAHLRALRVLGPSPAHRATFAPVAACLRPVFAGAGVPPPQMRLGAALR